VDSPRVLRDYVFAVYTFSRNRTIFAQCLLSLRAIRGAREREAISFDEIQLEFGNQRRDGPTLKSRAARGAIDPRE